MKSTWLDWVCFEPELSKQQIQQTALLSGERNPMDDCAACMMEILNINDATNVNLTLESLSQIQYDKLRHGHVKTDFLRLDQADTDSFFTEDQKAFLSIFKKSLLTKTELGLKTEQIDTEEVPKNSLFDANQQLLFAHYLLQCISARDSKHQLLYTLNAFRSIQKRITLELREMGSRDRVVADCSIVKPLEKQGVTQKLEDLSDGQLSDLENKSAQNVSSGGPDPAQKRGGAMGSSANAKAGEIDNMIQDEMVDINRFKFNNVFNNPIWSTCPIVPKYHSTFGEPIDRQEETAEYELNKDSDPKKGQAQRLIGRVDKIEEHSPSKCYIVTDDYGVNVMYDATFMDMRALE